VYFRAYTKEKADELGVRGWVMNLPSGNVQGEAQGPSSKIAELREWLRTTGSPRSRIDKLEATEVEISDYTFSDFKIRR